MPMSNVGALTKLPAPSASPSVITEKTVLFCADDNWQSRSWSISLDDWVVGQRHRVTSSMFDQATYVAFNLPIGTVVTLMDDAAPLASGRNAADLSDCGRCVDLVGTGKTEAVDLSAVNMNDCVSAFLWREVDLDLGAIELFDEVNFSGNRTTLFLSEWNPGQLYSIGSWWLQDRVSSIRWSSLSDRQTAVLFDNTDGSGDAFTNIMGYGSHKECASLPDFSFNDRMSSFRWDAINPKKEIIAPFDVKVTNATETFGLTAVVTGTNNSSVAQPVQVTLTNTDSQSATVSTTDTQVVTVKSSFSQKYAAGALVETAETSWSVQLSYSYTQSATKSSSDTQTVTLAVSETVNAPAMTSYKATLLVTLGRMPPTLYRTTAQRWYDQAVTGGVKDPVNNNWYKRVEPITVTVEGNLSSNIAVSIDAKALPA